jgi:hypothetical protein
MSEAAAQALLSKVWGDIQRTQMKIDAATARKNPKVHKAINLFDGGMNWRYYEAPKTFARGRRVRFCRSVSKNVAGYYLTWIEITNKTHAWRLGFKGWDTKAASSEYIAWQYRESQKPKGECRVVLPKGRK